jgi:hypothetical protein
MTTESKGVCQRCGEHFIFPTEMQGQDVDCPHCGKQTTLVVSSQPIENEQSSLLTDPNWDDRLPPGPIRILGKGAHGLMQLVYALFILAGLLVLGFIALRLLHAAWGY